MSDISSTASTRDEILAIIAKETGIEPGRLTPEATIEDLGIQSIDLVQSIFAIETRFDIEIPVGIEQEGGNASPTLGGLVDRILARIDRAGADA